jgi:hypothetical protein
MGHDVPDPDPTPRDVDVPVTVRGRRFDFALVPTPQPFGGLRWWLRCERCGVRRSAFYAVRSTTSRVAPWGAPCVSASRTSRSPQRGRYRHQFTLHRIVRRLGGRSTGYGIPTCPTSRRGCTGARRIGWPTRTNAAKERRHAALHTVTVARTFARLGA